MPMRNGGTYAQRTGFCFEIQQFPDAVNQEKFPSVFLNPGENYITKTIFKFFIK